MSDNIYRVLMGDNAPFLGAANISYCDRILKGKIIKVHYDLMKDTQEDSNPDLCQYSYRTVDVEWLEGKPRTSNNVPIPELVSYLGYGLNYLPSVGDIVYFGFDSNNLPQIVNIVSRASVYEHGALSVETKLPELNKYGDVIIDRIIDDILRPTPIRYIEPGEISLTSLNSNSELYFDKNGTLKLISRTPILNKNDDGYINGLQCGDRLWELSIGKDVKDEGNNTIKKSSFGNNIQFQILGHQNGCQTNFDSEGNIEIINNGCTITINKEGRLLIQMVDNGQSIEINKDKIILGNGNLEPAVLGNTLQSLLETIISMFNSHTHVGNLGYPTLPPDEQITIEDVRSKNVEVN